VFRHRGFTAGALAVALGFGAMFGANVLTPLWLQSDIRCLRSGPAPGPLEPLIRGHAS